MKNREKVKQTERWLWVNLLHFTLTTVTMGLWAPVWWWCANRADIKESGVFHQFDNDYWDYIVERDEPPAALYPTRFDLTDEIRFGA